MVFLLCLSNSLAGEEFEFFEKRIRPVLVERCYRCHSATSEKLKGGLHLDSRDGLRAGGKSGRPAVVPGRPAESRLIEAIRYENQDLQMPPKERLSTQQVEDFVAWVNAGAPDPRTNAVADLRSRIVMAERHWAFQPPRPRPLPAVKQKSWPQTPIDYFILARLEQEGLKPSPPADRRTLLRRLSYDLTGLPPTSAAVASFLADRSSEAVAKVVDRLLNSPSYGERWGRHWLDVARYSDTKGYVYDRDEKQFVHAHVYRDWVIQAFNLDLPYDQFLIAQIAGDQLPGALTAPSPTASPLAALGFLTLGRRFLGVKHDIIDDRIDVLTRGTMGLTVACARCHDHKYDPISMRDYYALYGVFNSSTERTVPLASTPMNQRSVQEFEAGLREREQKLQTTFVKKRAQLTERLRTKTGAYLRAVLEVDKLPSEEFYAIMSADDLNPVVVRQWDSYLFKSRGKLDPVFGLWHALARVRETNFAAHTARLLEHPEELSGVNPVLLDAFRKQPPTSMAEVAEGYGKVLVAVDRAWHEALALAATNQAPAPTALDPDREVLRQVLYGPDSPATVPPAAIVDIEWFFDEPSRVELAKLQAEIDRWIINSPGAPPHAVILADRPEPRNARILLRGNPANPGEEVPRRFLELLARAPNQSFSHGSGRLELARAVASPGNPLTARVLVNRIWQHHFGAGLVRTPSDFGVRAEPPSHPELLDWLALRFVEEGWSIKKLHRLILLSAVYQQSSDAAPGSTAPQVDPANRFLARMNKRRLDFEAMRDSLLAVTGELDLRQGGRPSELFATKTSFRRSVYGQVDRQFVPGVLRMFDFANPDLHIPQRSDTTVPQQALFFMNSPFVVQRARTLASRAANGPGGGTDANVRRLYQMAYQREPTPEQRRAAIDFIRDAITEPIAPPTKPQPTAWQYGYGTYDAQAGRITNFTALPHFTGSAWQGGPDWPDPRLGWVQLTAEGGHAGNDLQHAAIRRWTAPVTGAVSLRGTIKHEHPPGDGINARVISSRRGQLGSWQLHNSKVEGMVERTEVERGDTIDFVVDLAKDLNSDMFKWAPVVKLLDANGGSETSEWAAQREFGGPPPPPPQPLSAWEKFAQVLLLANEFLFVD